MTRALARKRPRDGVDNQDWDLPVNVYGGESTNSRQQTISESVNTKNSEVRPHAWTELSEILSPLSHQEQETLRASILAHGVVEPVKVLPDGRIVDGLHRWKLSNGKAQLKFLQLDPKAGFELA